LWSVSATKDMPACFARSYTREGSVYDSAMLNTSRNQSGGASEYFE